MIQLSSPTSVEDIESGESVASFLSIALQSSLVLLNIGPIVVVCRYAKHFHNGIRTSTDELLAFLALIDILSVIIPSSFRVTVHFSSSDDGIPYCEFYGSMVSFFQLSSLLLVSLACGIQLHTPKDLANALTSTSGTEIMRMRTVAAAVCACALGISCLPFIRLNSRSNDDGCRSWLIDRPTTAIRHLFWFSFVGLAVMNLFVFIFFLYHTSVKKSPRPDATDKPEVVFDKRLSTVELMGAENRSVIAAVGGVLYIIWLPALVLLILRESMDCPAALDQVIEYLVQLTLAAGIVNPIIYSILSLNYRRGYSMLLIDLSTMTCGFRNPPNEDNTAAAALLLSPQLDAIGQMSDTVDVTLAEDDDACFSNHDACFSNHDGLSVDDMMECSAGPTSVHHSVNPCGGDCFVFGDILEDWSMVATAASDHVTGSRRNSSTCSTFDEDYEWMNQEAVNDFAFIGNARLLLFEESII